MDETKKTPETAKEETAGDSDEGSKPQTDARVEQLNADTERINQAIAENENAKARQKLSGTAEAGQVPKKETDDEKYNREAKERYAGTGMDPTDDESPTEYK